ncbi:hypothetical protein ACOMHN_007920 [Nucella lapillus]
MRINKLLLFARSRSNSLHLPPQVQGKPIRLDLVLLLDPAYQDERVRLVLRKSPSLQSKSRASHDVTTCIFQVLWRRRNDEAVGEDSLEAVVVNMHTGGSGHVVALHWTEAAVESGSLLSDRSALFRIALLASTA